MKNKAKEIEKLGDSILNLVVDNFDYFRENPKHLAWAMMNFDLVYYSGRRLGSCNENPKDIIIDKGEKLDKKRKQPNNLGYKDSDLLYDAWGVCVSNDRKFPDVNPNLPLESKSNKTLDEWVELLTDKRYEYHDLFHDRRAVEDNLLCTIGTGMGWNKDGFITNLGPSEVDEIIFAGYTRAENEVRKDLRNKILKIRNNHLIAKEVKKYLRDSAINAGNNEAEKTILNNGWKVKERLKKLPSKEKKKVMQAFRDVAYLEAIVNEAKDWTEEEWREARKNNIYNYYGKKINISEIGIDYCHNTCGFKMEVGFKVERGEKIKDYRKLSILNRRYSKWGNFVYELKPGNPEDPKLKQAKIILEKPQHKVSKEKVREARKYLNSQRPNFKRYKPILGKAEKGDEEAAALLDKLSGVPARGWDSIRYFALDENRETLESLEKHGGRKRQERRTYYPYYPLGKYSALVEMSDNAHPSYIEAGIKIAKEILEMREEDIGQKELVKTYMASKKYAKQFLEKWENKL